MRALRALREIQGFCGSNHTPCDILVYEKNGGRWYVVEGSDTVNFTYDPIELGTDVEELNDNDVFMWSPDIENLEMLEIAVDFE